MQELWGCSNAGNDIFVDARGGEALGSTYWALQMIYSVALWLSWCALNLLLMALARPRVPAYTGFRIVMPESLKQQLTIEEYCAVLAHETGHKHYKHAWWNYARVCVFWFPSKTRLTVQELQADDYAISQGCGIALSTALRKLSRSPMDWVRAKRLEEQDWTAYLRKGYSAEEEEEG